MGAVEWRSGSSWRKDGNNFDQNLTKYVDVKFSKIKILLKCILYYAIYSYFVILIFIREIAPYYLATFETEWTSSAPQV